jgi:hypothetical protein
VPLIGAPIVKEKSMRVPTVCVTAKGGFIVINKSDFDKKVHTLYVERKIPKKTIKVTK